MLRRTCRNVASAAAFSLIFAVLMLYSSSCRVSAPMRLSVREFFPPQNISNSQVHLVLVARLPENTTVCDAPNQAKAYLLGIACDASSHSCNNFTYPCYWRPGWSQPLVATNQANNC